MRHPLKTRYEYVLLACMNKRPKHLNLIADCLCSQLHRRTFSWFVAFAENAHEPRRGT